MVSIDLNERAALITGSGRGIGRAIAIRLAQAGAAVFVTDLDASAVADTVQALRSAGARAEGLEGDLTSPGFPEHLVANVLQRFGSVDIVVNNAGYTWDNVIQKTTDE
ncbi:MAG TPA: SDR family NAD(P)-dependent oxidoreductase, partial [Bryobacteraceae bacterium]|nr:SDR family NAD(P)-dependent oxidoreductase [Bryobacteraceae bacterium]